MVLITVVTVTAVSALGTSVSNTFDAFVASLLGLLRAKLRHGLIHYIARQAHAWTLAVAIEDDHARGFGPVRLAVRLWREFSAFMNSLRQPANSEARRLCFSVLHA